jgi:tetratricopeptide (TPR) repeat protein
LEVEVLEQRKAKLGKEHPYTLWSACNLARIKALRGDIDEALSIMRPGIAIAERNLGATHIGTLFGKLHLGRVLLRAKQYQEAEEMFLAVIKAHEGNRTGHGDRLLAIFSLIKCRNLQGRRHETFNLREELLERTRAIFGKGHAWETYLLDPQNLSDSSPDSWVSRRSAEERKPIVPRLRSGGNQPGIARISTL